MKLGHFEALRPICPVCRKGALGISKVVEGTPRELLEGLLECAACRHLYPVIEGIPILARNLRQVVSDQVLGVLGRSDLSETTLQLIGECCGSGSAFDAMRQHLSSYCHGHWEEGSVVRVLDAGLAKVPASEGPILDLGCSVGRTTLHLAARDLVVGVDLSFSMLRMARRFISEKHVRYPRRVNGLVYEERSFDIEAPHAERVDFWCADALALPFAPETFGLVSSLNLLDVVPSPFEHLKGMRDVLRDGAAAVVASPFDWSPGATPVEQWIGGHSPLAPAGGRPEAALRGLIGSPHLPGLRVEAAVDGLGWPVRLHDRAEMHYQVDLLVLRRDWQGEPSSR